VSGKIFAGFCEVKNILLKSEIPEKWIYVNTEKNGNIARCQEKNKCSAENR
jgi:hypothetical protein